MGARGARLIHFKTDRFALRALAILPPFALRGGPAPLRAHVGTVLKKNPRFRQA